MFRFLRIHTVPAEEEGSTWLQLFFDLVYVAILIELGNRLSHNLDLRGIVEFAFIFVPIWWSWLEFVKYGRRYPIDDIGQRVLTVVYMAVMLLMAFEIHSLTGFSATAFVSSYALSKFVLAIMYGRAWFQFPKYRLQTGYQAAAFVVVGAFWMIIGLAAPTNLWLWTAAIALGVLAPGIIHLIQKAANRSGPQQPPLKHHFTLHRFGELTIIVLGEFFIKLVTSSAGRELSLVNYAIGACLLGISVSIWWLYFDHLEHANLAQAGTRIDFWIYSHYPFLLAITAYGVVGNQIFEALPRLPLDDAKRLLFTTALATAILAFGVIEWASREKLEPLSRSPQPWIRLGGAATLLLIGNLGRSLNVGWLVLLVISVLLVQVAFDIAMRMQRPEIEKDPILAADAKGED